MITFQLRNSSHPLQWHRVNTSTVRLEHLDFISLRYRIGQNIYETKTKEFAQQYAQHATWEKLKQNQ